MSTLKLSVFVIAFSVSTTVFANKDTDPVQPAKTANTAVTKSSLTQADINHAKQWKLTAKEYKRYKQILKSPRAYFTPNLDRNPLLALALESDSEIDRQRYSDIWVQIQVENNIKVVAWQLEVNKAWERLYPGVPRFAYKNPETSHYAVANMNNPASKSKVSDIFGGKSNQSPLEEFSKVKPRVQLYIAIDNCSTCVEAYHRQYELLQLGKYSGLDIHFVAHPSKEEIIEWAKARVVDRSLNASDVNQSRVVTLNTASKEVSKVPFAEFD